MRPARIIRLVEILLVEDNIGDMVLTQEILQESRVSYRLSVTRDGVEDSGCPVPYSRSVWRSPHPGGRPQVLPARAGLRSSDDPGIG